MRRQHTHHLAFTHQLLVRLVHKVDMVIRQHHQLLGVVYLYQVVLVVVALVKAYDNTLCNTIILPTGMGKTHGNLQFEIVKPNHNYKVVIHDAMTLRDIVDELCEAMKVQVQGTVGYKIRKIIIKTRELKRAGHKVMFRFEECENMNPKTLRAIKGLWDGVYDGGFASLVLMGTPKLLDMLQKARGRDAAGMPQLYRRLKAGIRVMPVNVLAGFKLFYEKLGITDKGLQSLLNGLCDNYGELHDYLEPVLREADARGEEVTEDFFRLYHDLPELAKR